jgi:hypothetical protein
MHEKQRESTYGYKRNDFLAIFDQLYADTFANGRIWLFGLNTDFFENNTLGVR